ncbi:hypothetical protein HDU93_004491 [Gonapodya sp. JEL0774]|nr:hypothetical protein HDU93_004491 [Gonapodya sp. JEL0774]
MPPPAAPSDTTTINQIRKSFGLQNKRPGKGQRVSLACDNCHASKKKCDGEQDCIYNRESTNRARSNYVLALEQKLAHIERKLSGVAPSLYEQVLGESGTGRPQWEFERSSGSEGEKPPSDEDGRRPKIRRVAPYSGETSKSRKRSPKHSPPNGSGNAGSLDSAQHTTLNQPQSLSLFGTDLHNTFTAARAHSPSSPSHHLNLDTLFPFGLTNTGLSDDSHLNRHLFSTVNVLPVDITSAFALGGINSELSLSQGVGIVPDATDQADLHNLDVLFQQEAASLMQAGSSSTLLPNPRLPPSTSEVRKPVPHNYTLPHEDLSALELALQQNPGLSLPEISGGSTPGSQSITDEDIDDLAEELSQLEMKAKPRAQQIMLTIFPHEEPNLELLRLYFEHIESWGPSLPVAQFCE